MSNWSVLSITQTPGVTDELIVITTNNPCHLTLYWSLNHPLRHKYTRYIRGLATPWGAYFCFTAVTAVEQQEPGDTLIHTFDVTGWPECETRYFVFKGTFGGVTSPSISAIYQKHHKSRYTVVLSAIKDTWCNRTHPNMNFGNTSNLVVINNLWFYATRTAALISFDTKFIPPWATILSADLLLSFYASDMSGKTHWAFKLLWDDWIETQATFNQRKAGSPWSTGSLSPADLTTVNPAGGSAVIITGPQPWQVTFNVIDIVQDSLNPLVNSNFIITAFVSTTGTTRYDSRTAARPADRPVLTIVYE